MSHIAITMGCPVGIGPEIILKYFKNREDSGTPPPIVVGDVHVLQHTARHLGFDISCSEWKPGQPLPATGIPVYSISQLDIQDHQWGRPTKKTGQAMAAYIETAVRLCRKGLVDGIVTCPISKSSLQKSGYNYPGHTEMLADLTGETNFTMMMAGEKLRITLVTIHCSLRDVADTLTFQSVYHKILLTYTSLIKDFNIANPRIALAGLNPHAGEDGLFGSEESDAITPAAKKAQNEGINVSGPLPPDTVFLKAIQGEYDAVVCMYHDQGLIPFKLLHFSDGVNVTIGLSIVRTSVDHGTAYDIAGTGIADSRSLTAAVKLAFEIAANRKLHIVENHPSTSI
jgi:4-hydroxythreonine-4-phosphate dehydrogenase